MSDLACSIQIVSNHEHGDTSTGEPMYYTVEVLDSRRVETRSRFVQKQYGGVTHQSQSDGDFLTHISSRTSFHLASAGKLTVSGGVQRV